MVPNLRAAQKLLFAPEVARLITVKNEACGLSQTSAQTTSGAETHGPSGQVGDGVEGRLSWDVRDRGSAAKVAPLPCQQAEFGGSGDGPLMTQESATADRFSATSHKLLT